MHLVQFVGPGKLVVLPHVVGQSHKVGCTCILSMQLVVRVCVPAPAAGMGGHHKPHKPHKHGAGAGMGIGLGLLGGLAAGMLIGDMMD